MAARPNGAITSYTCELHLLNFHRTLSWACRGMLCYRAARLRPNLQIASTKPRDSCIFLIRTLSTPSQLSEFESDPDLPIVVSEDGTHALRRRRYDHRPLPLPPHMDPVRTAQRNQWKKNKTAPLKWEDKSEFQKKLEQNVYGMDQNKDK